MRPDATGTWTKTDRGYVARFSLGHSSRKSTILRDCKSDAEADRRTDAIAAMVARLLAAGLGELAPGTIREGGKLDARQLAALAKRVDAWVSGKVPAPVRRRAREGTTVAQLAEEWTSGKLAAAYPDHVKVKKTSHGDAKLFDRIAKVRLSDGRTFGDRPVAEVTLDDCDHVMASLPKTTQASATRRHYAQAIRKLLTYAVYPLRIREAMPIPKGWLPKIRNDKAKAWIYPSEDAALMGATGPKGVPLPFRVLFGFLVREGMRMSEALALTWNDLDLERGVVRLDTTKTDDPRSWALGADVARALAAWKALRGAKAKKVPAVFPVALVGTNRHAQALREGLALAGVKRPELLVEKAGRLRLRAHDLRGSFTTIALANGRSEAWVTDRTGHKSSAMIYRYKRAARTAAELALGWFAPLDEAIPELSGSGNGVATGGPTGSERSGRPPTNTGKGRMSGRLGTGPGRFKIHGRKASGFDPRRGHERA